MSTRFVWQGPDVADEYTGQHAGIGVDSDTPQFLIVNPDGTKRQASLIPLTGTAFASDGAITTTCGLAFLTKGSAGAYTLASPTGLADGTILHIRSKSAFAHTVTYTPGFLGDTTSSDVGTFAAKVGAGLMLMAINSLWHIVSNQSVTVA